MVKDGYKETEIGVIPEDWDVAKLSDILRNRNEKYLPKACEEKPYIALEHIDQELGRLHGIGKSSETTSTKNAFYKNDILFGKLRPYLKKYWLSNIDGVCSTEILALLPLQEPRFAFYLIQMNKFIENVSQKAFGTKMPRTSWADIKDYKIPLPSIQEQQRIADILSTTDAHIERLDKLIEDYQLLKKGMMKKLLTEGIGHTEYKETEIGWIPKEWDVKQIKDIVSINRGFAFKSSEYSDDGIFVLRVTNISANGDIKKNDIKFVSLECAEKYKTYALEEHDVLLVMVGATTGKIGLIEKDILPALLNQNMWNLRPSGNITKLFIYYCLTENIKRFLNMKGGSAREFLTQKEFEIFSIPVPSVEEQKEIVEIFLAIDKRIALLISARQDFDQLKKGLMKKLLTGKIRTTELKSLEG